MASPFATLRKYQFAFFVFFGVALMIMFVIDDPLNRWLSSRSGQTADTNPVVVTWRGGSLTESELDYNQRVRNVILQFLSELLRETQNRKGFPNVTMPSLSPSEEGIVLSRVLASKAEASGLVVTNEAVMQYLEKLSADLIPRHEIGELFAKSAGNRMTEQQLVNELKIELLAQNYLAMSNPDPSRGQLPGQAWNYYQRLHRRVKAEVIPLTVASFKGQVNKDPTDAELLAIYEKGKDRYPDPQLAEPGFKRHRKAAFEYVRVDRKKFDDEEAAKLKPQITVAEIDEYYVKNKEEFRIKETDEKPKENADKPSDEKPTAEKPAAEKPADDKPAAEKSSDKPAEKTSAEKPAESPATNPTKENTETKPADSKKADDAKPTDSPAPSSPEKSDVKKSDDADPAKKDEPTADKPCGEDPQDESAKNEQENKPQEKPAAEKEKAPADQPPAAQPPAADSKADTKPEESPKPSESTPPADKPETPAKPASDTPPAGTDASKSESAPKRESATKAEQKPAAYKPLDDKLREEIRTKIANQKGSQIAQERITKALNEIRAAVEKYARKLKSAEIAGGAKPPRVDVAKMAADRALEHGNVPLSDPNQIKELELGKTFQFDFSGRSFQEIGFDLWAYADGIPLFKPDQIQGRDFNIFFLYWKTENVDPVVPKLEDIRSEVVDAWKQKEALNVATAKANSMAEAAKAAGKPLKEVFANEKDLTVKETNEFSWMTTGSVAAGMGMPALSSVDGVELAGQDFMKAVFALKTGETGVAVNESKAIVYVVRILSESPSEEILREMFLTTGASMDVQQVAARDRAEIFNNWRTSLEREMEVKWSREPRT